MPVEPIPCAPEGGGGEPVEVVSCCSPSIASAPLCRQDGSTVLLVVRSGCAECGETAADPAAVGWIDAATGTFTPGPLPPDAGPCDAGCVDTVCRTLCDDTTGDGQADTTYSELWCIRQDGTAELVLTYQDDPSTPYTPVSPVECEYGCPETETLTLCDESGPFLRRYTWLNGAASFLDFALDGTTPHVVTGTVGTCTDTGAPCEEQTTPAATLGLCLPDGTPLAVIITRDCATGTVTQDGWLNLTTGTYTPGPPPAGAAACGDSRAFELAGLLCDVDPTTEDVYGLVLVEYAYNADGSLASVRLVDPATGTTYTLQGELRRCPGGQDTVPEQDLTVLCDVQPDGTSTAFVRDYRRDPVTGAVTGHTDYALDGTPYTPTGTVGVCPAESPCLHCSSRILCDLAPDPVQVPAMAQAGTLSNGVGYTITGATSQFGQPWFVMNQAAQRWTFTETVSATWGVQIRRAGDCLVLPEGAELVTLAGTHTYDAATRRLCGTVATDTSVSTFRHPGTAELVFTASGSAPFIGRVIGVMSLAPASLEFERTTCRDCDGQIVSTTDTLLTGAPYTPTGTVGSCTPDVEPCGDTEVLELCDQLPDGTSVPFLRRLTYDCAGAVVASADTTLDGVTPYAITGTVGQCTPPCRDTSTTLLCDVAALDTVTVLDTVNRASADGWQITSFTDGGCTGYNPPDGPIPGPPVWSDGYLSIRADRNLGTVCQPWSGYEDAPLRWVLTKTFTAPEDGTAVITADAFRGDGGARVRVNGQDVGLYGQWNQPAVGGSAQVPVTAGPNVVEIEVHDIGGPNWLRGRLDVVMTRTTQFFRKQVTDCTTGAVVSTTDTTLDGQPYTPTGEVGQCEPVAECCEPPAPETRLDVETAVLCMVEEATGTSLGQVLVELVYDDQTGARTEQRLTDPTTGDPVTLPPGTILAPCQAEPTECRNSTTLLVCDLPAGGTPTATVTDTDPTPYYPYPTAAPVAGAQALWDGGTLTLPPGTGPQPGTTGRVNSLAATITAPRPGCDTGTAHVTVTVNVQQTGPDNGCGPTGHLRLFTGTTQTALTVLPAGTPNGYFGTLTVEADVPAADLAAGNVAFALALDAYDDTAACAPSPRRTGWTLSAFTTAVTYGQDGCETQFLRTVTVDCETGAVTGVEDTTLDGQPYTPTGEVGQCTPAGGGQQPPAEPCRNTSTVLLCDASAETETVTPAVTSTTLAGLDLSSNAAYPLLAGSWAPLWSGGALVFPQEPNASAGDGVQVYRTVVGKITGTVPDNCATASGDLTVSVRVRNDGPNPGLGGSGVMRLYRNGVLAASVGVAVNPPVGHVQTLTATVPVTAADLTSGALTFLLALETFHGAPKSWTADQFTVTSELAGCAVQFLRNLVTDCATGEVVTVTDTTLDGQPYTVTGEVGQCQTTGGGECCPPPEPCGDTEVIQLCDLTYDPQAPIPTPASAFTLTGNVVAGNEGTTLWFAQANQPATGVAELLVSGLLPATLYEYRFASAWIGAGGSDPVGNAAIYRLDILDGATVLATRTRNVSNGSAVFPGGVLAEDMPPLAFIAPATGAVTIRFTDLTTGGPVNDRDLFLMPFEVRTAALTVTRTPFLRRLTFACDGSLTTSEDVGLDGFTPYAVEGEVGQCAGDGTTETAVPAPCPAQNVLSACRCDDTDGNGIADTEYVELLAVDCDGNLTSVGTYTEDLSAPYTPVSPVDCATGDPGAEPAVGVQAHRVQLEAGQTWSAAAVPALRSVTLTAHTGTGEITTTDGTSTLFRGESVTWSVDKELDAALLGPLDITAVDGVVTVTFTTGGVPL